MSTINEFFVNVPAEVLASLQGLDLAVIPQPLRGVIFRLPSALLNAAPPISSNDDKIASAKTLTRGISSAFRDTVPNSKHKAVSFVASLTLPTYVSKVVGSLFDALPTHNPDPAVATALA